MMLSKKFAWKWGVSAAVCFSALLLLGGEDAERQVKPKEDTVPAAVETVPVLVIKDTPRESPPPKLPLKAEEKEAMGYPEQITFYREEIPLSSEEQQNLYDACREFGVPIPLALAVIEKETRFKNIPGDSGNASGYMQIWVKWHKDRMVSLGEHDLSNPQANFRVGCSYLGELLERYGNETDALTAYNTGSPGESQYDQQVLENRKKWEEIF